MITHNKIIGMNKREAHTSKNFFQLVSYLFKSVRFSRFSKVCFLFFVMLMIPLSSSEWMDPLELISPDHIDPVVMHLYARYQDKQYETDVHKRLMRQFQRVIGNEFPGEAFDAKFLYNLDRVKANGFNSQLDTVYVDPLHMVIENFEDVGLGLYLKKDILVEKRSGPICIHDKSLAYYQGVGLSDTFLDMISLEYFKVKKHSYYALSIGNKSKGIFYNTVDHLGEYVHEKVVNLTKQGFSQFIMQFPKHVQEVLLSSKEYKESTDKLDLFLFHLQFEDQQGVNDFHTCLENHPDMVEGYFFMPLDRKHQWILGSSLCHNKSLEFFNKRVKSIDRFENLVDSFYDWASENQLEKEQLLIDLGGVVSAYGLRKCKNINFHYRPESFGRGRKWGKAKHRKERIRDRKIHNKTPPFIVNRFNDTNFPKTNLEKIFFDPSHYFYYKGLKFMALEDVKAIKKKRHLIFDKIDLRLLREANL